MLISFTALSENITLTPMQTINQSTLVTLGVPLPKGKLNDINQFKLYDESGKEINKFIKPTLYWFDDNHKSSSIRSVKIQFELSKLDAPVNYSFTINSSTNLTPLSEKAIAPSLISEVNKSYHPKVMATLSPEYLVLASLIAPFATGESNDFYKAQLKWVKEFNYATSTIANWLFDRTTAVYKGCMSTGDVSCYKEAYMSYHYWMSSLKREGNLDSCKGGSLLAGEPKNCDSKYVYTEQIKLHVALTGDDSQHDLSFVRDIAAMRDQHYYQPKVDDPYDNQNESFTERAAGLVLLAQINAYEITGDVEIYENILQRINVLYEHQNSNPDGLLVEGAWRHSWAKHEGGDYPGDGKLDDRRFSPWMTENIVDSLWQAFQLTSDQRIPEMIIKASRALIDWGFTDSGGYKDKYQKSLEDYSGKSWHLGCNTTGDTLLYSATSVGSIDALVHTQNQNGFYSDSHNAEAIFMLSLGYYFENDEEYKELIRTRINSIKKGYLNTKCGEFNNTPRMFNWSNRSNYWGTYNWVSEQDPSLTYEVDLIEEALSGDIEEDFTDVTLSPQWVSTDYYEYTSQGAIPIKKGVQLFEPLVLDSAFQMDLVYVASSASTLHTGVVLGLSQEGFYSVRVKSGAYGNVYIYKHEDINDFTGQLISQPTPVASTLNEEHKLTVRVEDSIIKIKLDNTLILTHDTLNTLNEGQLGLLVNTITDSLIIKKLVINKSEPRILYSFTDDFKSDVSVNWLTTGIWTLEGGYLVSEHASRILTVKKYMESIYMLKSDIVLYSSQGNLLAGVVFGESEDDSIYAIKIKGGLWGGVYLYKLSKSTLWDVSGVYMDSISMPVSFGDKHNLMISVNNKQVSVILDDQDKVIFTLAENIVVGNPGFVSLTSNKQSGVNNFNLSFYEQ